VSTNPLSPQYDPDRATSLEVYADGVTRLAETVKSDSGWLRALALALRDTASTLRGVHAPTHRHRKGGLYQELMRGFWEPDVTGVVVYRHEDGTVWVRNAVEFDDPNRFQPL
jgi:hypothetical protein